jgi:hypothetical protein
VKELFLIVFVVSGLAFAPVQHSDAQVYIGTPENQGIGIGPGVNYGYPHFEYEYYPRGGYYYRQPYYGYYGGSSHYRHHGHRVYRHYRQDEQ